MCIIFPSSVNKSSKTKKLQTIGDREHNNPISKRFDFHTRLQIGDNSGDSNGDANGVWARLRSVFNHCHYLRLVRWVVLL